MDSKCQSPVLTKPVLSDVCKATANDEAQLGEGKEEEGESGGEVASGGKEGEGVCVNLNETCRV